MKTLLAALALSTALAAPAAFAAELTVHIKSMKFTPKLAEVSVGDTITFVNEDAVPHTATADDGSFDTGRLNRGESATVTISAVGQFTYKCLVHPSMKGVVSVAD
jgi:plastocyanin